MKTISRITRWRRSMVAVASTLLLMALVGGSSAWAGGGHHRGWTTVSGTAIGSDCGGDWAFELSGDLEGCWAAFPEGFSCDELNGFALLKEWGREEFNGTRNREPGRFVTKYTFEGVYPTGFCSTFEFTSELAGGCDHYIRGKSGAFRRAWGHIRFFDIIPGIRADGNGNITPGTTGGTDFFYVGKLNR